MSVNQPPPTQIFPAPDFSGIINSINGLETNIGQVGAQFQQIGTSVQNVNSWFSNLNKQDWSNWGVRILLIVIGLVFIVFGLYKLL